MNVFASFMLIAIKSEKDMLLRDNLPIAGISTEFL